MNLYNFVKLNIGKMKKLPVIFVVAMTFMSCGNKLLYRMEVLRPGYVAVSSEKNKVLIVDNSVSIKPWYGRKMLYSYDVRKDTASFTDSLSTFLLKSIDEDLLHEEFYKNIQLNYRPEGKSEKSGNESVFRTEPLSKEKIKKLGESNNVDLIFSLDWLGIQFNDSLCVPQKDDDFVYKATRNALINSVWRIYDVQADSLIAAFLYKNTLYWDTFSSSSDKALRSLSSFEKILPRVGDAVGENVARILGPHWEGEERFFFCRGGYRMRLATDCILKEDWKGASVYWEEEYRKGFGRSVYRAAMNMMLYYEVVGSPNDALDWSRKAEQAMDRMPFFVPKADTKQYVDWVQKLIIRSQEYEKLKIYFKGILI